MGMRVPIFGGSRRSRKRPSQPEKKRGGLSGLEKGLGLVGEIARAVAPVIPSVSIKAPPVSDVMEGRAKLSDFSFRVKWTIRF